MDSLYFLIPLALILTGLAIKFLFWALNSGQYDDLDTEAHRILFDEDLIETKPKKSAAAISKPHSK
jgi:cbb3-type cytochrome oxidase maturation protein|tara:strand:+ start:257 stop:454 length:198 start_codon:yes stop_codon:yes gene_type:complete